MATIRNDRGWFYIRKNRKPNSWSLYYEFYKDGVRQSPEKVAVHAFIELGLKSSMTTDEARQRCSQLNQERKIDKDRIKSITGAAKNLVELQSLNEVLFPKGLLKAFEETIDSESFGLDPHKKRLKSHFYFVQKLVIKLKIYPRQYRENALKVYQYLVKEKASVDYSKKILAMLNRWGEFVCKTEGSYFAPIKVPRGKIRASIADAQKTKKGKNTELGVRTESAPIKPELLKGVRDLFSNPHHYNWLNISLWFGLRPSEVDSLKGKKWDIEDNRNSGIKALKVYQSKLTGVPEDQRYKKIPILFQAQHDCIALIESGQFARPHSKTVRKHLGNEITLYGGRKGFTDLMLEKEQRIEDISVWLGHTSIETTWKHYKDKKTIQFRMTNEIAKQMKSVTGA